MEPETIKTFCSTPERVRHFSRTVASIGLWKSEEIVFRRLFQKEDALLDLGTGAGRIALCLWELGYHKILGIDHARPMIEEARKLAGKLEYAVPFRVADATRLPFDDAVFEGAVFGFNGWCQIPGRDRRRAALREILRVLRPGAKFVFTTHDRDDPRYRETWEKERILWKNGPPNQELQEFGDLLFEDEAGPNFIHIPRRSEVEEDLAATGWTLLESEWRSAITQEPPEVTAISTDCLFWVCRK